MNQDTPAVDIKDKDRSANTEALKTCLDKILNRTSVKNVLDIRYGLGGWAKTVAARFPQATIVGYEQDGDTFGQAWKSSRCKLIQKRFPDTRQWTGIDLLLADFNTVTVLKRKLVDEAILLVQPRLFIFTDVCCSKLHLNWTRYDLAGPSLSQYWAEFHIPGYRFITYAHKHHAASTALYVKR